MEYSHITQSAPIMAGIGIIGVDGRPASFASSNIFGKAPTKEDMVQMAERLKEQEREEEAFRSQNTRGSGLPREGSNGSIEAMDSTTYGIRKIKTSKLLGRGGRLNRLKPGYKGNSKGRTNI
jgi:hypothetical protein